MTALTQPDRATTTTALSVRNLSVTIGNGGAEAVRDVRFEIRRGEAVGLVGESGSGKTLTCRSMLGLLPPGCDVAGGRAFLDRDGNVSELTDLGRRQWDGVRGVRLSAVFQDPSSYLNPSLTVGAQLVEQLRVKHRYTRRAARAKAVELFGEVGLHRPDLLVDRYPHELSGGMLQRVLIAIAVSCEPELLVADEATTALDVVIQAEILELLQRLRREHDLALLLVTHDLAVVAETCERTMVMYAGEIVESGPTDAVLNAPTHPYTEALMRVASVGDWNRPSLDVIPGQPPDVGATMAGCRFAPRCGYTSAACTATPVPLRESGPDQASRCVRVDESTGADR